MTTTATVALPSAAAPLQRLRARGRASGALVMTFFGAWWAVAGIQRSSWPAWSLAIVGVVAVRIAAAALQTLRANPSVDEPLPADLRARQRRAGRIFAWTCAAEVLGILVGVNLVANLGHPELEPVAVMLPVGLHFLPLASAFHYRPHLATGVALTAWALAYPALLAGGALAPVGLVAAGAILAASSAWALRSVR